jgi:glycosyltransferase involved in cell wall biosynthesis
MEKKSRNLKVIFHHPRPMKIDGTSGTEVRPYKMLKAFKDLGVQVIEVTGALHERRKKIREVRSRITSGEPFDFVYAENLTIPYAMSEPHRLPLNPLIDHRFLNFCSSKGVPVALFNRDVHWRDPSYQKKVPWWVRMITLPLYWADWLLHIKYLDTLYLPSNAMREILPLTSRFNKIKYLPPGTEISNTPAKNERSSTFRVFYVGGIAPPNYDLRPLFIAVEKAKTNIELTVCCREKEWLNLKPAYQSYLNDSITVVHLSGKELASMYEASDLLAVVRSMATYIDRSVPIKIYESIGFAVPILCTPGGETARIVEETDLGWVKAEKDIPSFLDELVPHPNVLADKKGRLKEIQAEHTWKSRAEQVCNEMTS